MDNTANRPILTLLDDGHRCSTGRAAMTCHYKCGNACAQDAPNVSDNPYFGDVLGAAFSRRGLLRAGTVITAAGLASTALGAAPVAATSARTRAVPGHTPGLGFKPVPPNTLDQVTIPPGFVQDVVIRWGDPLFEGAPKFDLHNQTPSAQKQQFGYNNDFLGLMPLERGKKLMVINHEYTSDSIMFPDYDEENPTEQQVKTSWAAHGLSVVAVKEVSGSGNLKPIVGHPLNRRFHTRTEFELTGPVRGSKYVRTKEDPDGTTVLATLNNCAGGLTQWGTWLTGEENYNQYFANAESVTDPVEAARLARYGIVGGESQRKWERFDDRFDIAKEPNEPNRFGWIVEVDPYDPTSTPKKRTALGRFKHEAAQPRVTADGHVAVYMGDDERFDYFYKFVSAKKLATGTSRRARRHNATLLDEGTLYVAQFNGDSPPAEIDGTGTLPADEEFDGSGRWIPLVSGSESFIDGMNANEVLLFTRQAADRVGATKMDRPEDVEPSPKTGTVYIALTNNTDRGAAGKPGVDEANPRKANKSGHVIELVERQNDSGAKTFKWQIFLVCGDPNDPSTYFGGYDKSDVSPISCPDNVTFDPHGNLWISTDGNAIGSNDGLFGVAVEGDFRGRTKQFLTVPVGAETCGPHVDRRRVLVCVQHPGETDDATFENPGSSWPGGGSRVPRPAVVAVWKQDADR